MKNLKKPNAYNITWVAAGEDSIAVNPASGDWLLMNQTAKDILCAYESGMEIGEIAAQNPDVSPEDIVSVFRRMDESDFVSEKDVPLIHSCKDCHSGHFPTLAVLNLTENCNLKCTYCYVGAGENRTKYMTPETAFRIVDSFAAMNPGNDINITLHGGEPLLHYSLVEQIVNHVRQNGKKIGLTIQTNATLLTDERVRFLKENDVSIGVSIDGPRECHDQTRVFPNGQGSFGQVMKGIRLLRENDVRFGTITVLTAHNIDQVDKILEFFIENRIFNLSFSPMQKIGRGADDNDSFLSGRRIFEAYKKIIDIVAAYNASPDRVEFLYERRLAQLTRSIFYNLHDFMCMRTPCGAGRDILGFSVDGGIYLCDDFINDDQFRIGSVFDGSIRDQLLTSRIYAEKTRRFIRDLPRCADCVWRNLCGGICYSSDYYSGANGAEENEMCEFYKLIIPYLIQKYAENPELPKLLDCESDPQSDCFIIRINDCAEGIDPQCLDALIKVHRINALSEVHLCWNRSAPDDTLYEMLRTVRQSCGSLWFAADITMLRISETVEKLLSENQADVIQLSFAQCPPASLPETLDSLKAFFEKRDKASGRISFVLNIPLDMLVKNHRLFLPFAECLGVRDSIFVMGNHASKRALHHLNTVLDGIRHSGIPAKIRVTGIPSEHFHTDNLLYWYPSGSKKTLRIDEEHLQGVPAEDAAGDLSAYGGA